MKKKNKKSYLNIINKIEKIRSKNNVNWMDILRVAFKNSPDESKKIVKPNRTCGIKNLPNRTWSQKNFPNRTSKIFSKIV